MTGARRRWLDPTRGLLKLSERGIDRFTARHVYPRVPWIDAPYSWQLPRRLGLAELELEPPRWPEDLAPLNVLLVSDIHTGPFLKPATLAEVLRGLMELAPDLVAIAGDIVTAFPRELDEFLDGLSVLSSAPLGAWFCLGNHDHFARDPEGVSSRLESIGIRTLRNRSVKLEHGEGGFTIGGIDDRILGTPDWEGVGAPNLLLAHNPDDFEQAQSTGVSLTLSGHTHGGQIRFRGGPPIIRHSIYSLDEGAYRWADSLLVVSRGLGAVGLPWRYGADPEAVLVRIRPPGEG